MALPPYNSKMNIEEALSQFDYAASNLALNYSLDSATDAYIAFSRLSSAIKENNYNMKDGMIKRYLLDTEACMGFLAKARNRYAHQEKRETEPKKLRDIKKRGATVNYYITLMREKKTKIRDEIKKHKNKTKKP